MTNVRQWIALHDYAGAHSLVFDRSSYRETNNSSICLTWRVLRSDSIEPGTDVHVVYAHLDAAGVYGHYSREHLKACLGVFAASENGPIATVDAIFQHAAAFEGIDFRGLLVECVGRVRSIKRRSANSTGQIYTTGQICTFSWHAERQSHPTMLENIAAMWPEDHERCMRTAEEYALRLADADPVASTLWMSAFDRLQRGYRLGRDGGTPYRD